jgi:hypothetical protein
MHDESVIRRVRRMKAEGATNLMIGMSIGSTESAVKALCNKHGIKRFALPLATTASSLG